MRITDFKNLKVERSSDFIKDDMAGIIVKTPEEIGKNVYGVYIGQMFFGTFTDQGPYENKVDISSNRCLNSVNKTIGEDSVTSSNFIHLTMFNVYNMSMPRLIKGENVLVGLIDQDIKSIYIKPFNRNQIKYRPTDILETFVPASGTYNGDDLTDENKYFVKMDSVNKTIRIHMSNANGEIAKYDITIDGENGSLSLSDGVRNIVMNTQDDEIVLTNEAKSAIVLRKETIDINCEKFYLRATDSMEIECPNTKAILDTVNIESDTVNGKIDSLTLEGSEMKETYDKAIIDNSDKRNITCPTTVQDGHLTVTGYVCPNKGIGFKTKKGVDPNSTKPMVNSKGQANFAGTSGKMVVLGPPLIQLLTQMVTKIEAISKNPKFPVVAPVLTPIFQVAKKQMVSKNIKG